MKKRLGLIKIIQAMNAVIRLWEVEKHTATKRILVWYRDKAARYAANYLAVAGVSELDVERELVESRAGLATILYRT